MNAQTIRRPAASKGRGGAKPRARKAPVKSAASPWPEGSGKLARYAFFALVAVMAIVALIALDLPGKALRATAVGVTALAAPVVWVLVTDSARGRRSGYRRRP